MQFSLTTRRYAMLSWGKSLKTCALAGKSFSVPPLKIPMYSSSSSSWSSDSFVSMPWSIFFWRGITFAHLRPLTLILGYWESGRWEQSSSLELPLLIIWNIIVVSPNSEDTSLSPWRVSGCRLWCWLLHNSTVCSPIFILCIYLTVKKSVLSINSTPVTWCSNWNPQSPRFCS